MNQRENLTVALWSFQSVTASILFTPIPLVSLGFRRSYKEKNIQFAIEY